MFGILEPQSSRQTLADTATKLCVSNTVQMYEHSDYMCMTQAALKEKEQMGDKGKVREISPMTIHYCPKKNNVSIWTTFTAVQCVKKGKPK